MPTFYERLQHYYSKPNSTRFSKKKIRRLHHSIKIIYDRNNNTPAEYIQSIEENGKSFQVRNYPYSFQKTIDDLIERMTKDLPKNIAEAIPKSAQVSLTPKKRKRILVQKPVFSMKDKPSF